MIRLQQFKRPRLDERKRQIRGSRPVLMTVLLLVLALASIPAAASEKPKPAKNKQGSGSALMTACPTYVTSVNNDKFLKLSGTSMAAAVTTGAAALVIEASRLANPQGPAITPNAVKAILQYTATVLRDDTGAPCDVLTQGAGGVNPAGAVGLASSINTGTPLGSPWLASSLVTYTSFGAVAEPWAQNIVWSGNIVWGN